VIVVKGIVIRKTGGFDIGVSDWGNVIDIPLDLQKN